MLSERPPQGQKLSSSLFHLTLGILFLETPHNGVKFDICALYHLRKDKDLSTKRILKEVDHKSQVVERIRSGFDRVLLSRKDWPIEVTSINSHSDVRILRLVARVTKGVVSIATPLQIHHTLLTT